MKIKPRVEDLPQSDAVQLSLKGAAGHAQGRKRHHPESVGSTEAERVDLGVGKAIRQQFDPAQLEAESRAKTDRIKKLLAQGFTYTGEMVAAKVANGIESEVQDLLALTKNPETDPK